MLFNSLEFAVFLPIIFLAYWLIAGENLGFQNILLLVASYFFYACWDWRFLFLLIFSTSLDYYTGIRICQSSSRSSRLIWFWLSVGINVGFLATFKYFDFFSISFAQALNQVGWHVDPVTLNVILPVGISFYTFHGLSYVIDIYQGRIRAERDFVNYSVFVSFFPLLVAGPIERATHLLPQIRKVRKFEYPKAADGLRQILWGLFKKIVIADQCASYVDLIFDSSNNYSGSTLLFGAILFAFQIYCDFSGYSDIALGTARLFGIELLRNFDFPYFSRDVAEFWRKWHISLSSWFRDYEYIPLGGSHVGGWLRARNTFIIFLLSGFWHGANWTFVIWGFLNACYIFPSIMFGTNRLNLGTVAAGRYLPTIRELFSMVFTFLLTVIAWVFFRAKDVDQAVQYLSGIFSRSLLSFPTIVPLQVCFWLLVFLVIEWLGREGQHAIANLTFIRSRSLRWTLYMILLVTTFVFQGKEKAFIYFQF